MYIYMFINHGRKIGLRGSVRQSSCVTVKRFASNKLPKNHNAKFWKNNKKKKSVNPNIH